MGIATNTVAGDVILRGDLTGTAASPQLSPTGVDAGTYAAAATIVDAKGRILYADAGTAIDIEGLVQLATTTNRGLAQPGTNISYSGVDPFIIFVPDASTSVKGVLQLNGSQGLQATAGLISAKEATIGQKGVVSVNETGYLTIDGSSIVSLTWPLTFPDATTLTRGVVQIGNNINVSSGLISVNTGSAATLGVLRVGTNVDVLAGEISLPDSTLLINGVVEVGANLSVSSGVIEVPIATTLVHGVVQIGTGLLVSSGEVTTNDPILTSLLPVATTSSKGLVLVPLFQPGYLVPNSIDLAAGVISAELSNGTTFGVIKSGNTSTIGITAGELSIVDGTLARVNVEQTFTDEQLHAVTSTVGWDPPGTPQTYLFTCTASGIGANEYRFHVIDQYGLNIGQWYVGDQFVLIITLPDQQVGPFPIKISGNFQFPSSIRSNYNPGSSGGPMYLFPSVGVGATETNKAIIVGTCISAPTNDIANTIWNCRYVVGFSS